MLTHHFPLSSSSSTPNFENRGLDTNYQIDGNGAFVSGGKISNYCYKSSLFNYIKGPVNSDHCSVCFRFKRGTAIDAWQIFCFAANSRQYIFYHYNNDIYTTAVDGIYQNNLITDDLWHNIIIIANQGTINMYIDGILKSTHTNIPIQTFNFGYYNNDHRGADFYIQDIRIYDYCLSQEEMHEYNAGLILHYPLNNAYNTSLTNMVDVAYQTGNSSSRASSITCTLTDDGYYKYVLRYTGTGGSTWPSISLPQVTAAKGWVAGNTYCFHIKFRVNSYSSSSPGLTFRASRLSNDYYGCKTTNLCQSAYLDGKWHTADLLQAVPASFTYSGSTITCTGPVIQLYCANLSTSGTVYTFDIDIAEFAIYDSTVSLPFIRNDFKTDIVYDCSGFGNDGTAVNISSIDTSSPRYNCSTKFNGSNSYIRAYRGAMVTDEITYSLWVKVAGKCTPISCTETGGWNIEQSTYIQAPIYAGGGYRTAVSTKTFANIANSWHMLTATWDGKQSKIYIDGVLEGSSTALSTKTPISYNASNGIFIGAEAGNNQSTPVGTYSNGSISDVRIYATALSADDIKLLYSRGASIDNTGKLHCGEITEGKSKIQVEKSTEVNCTDIDEVSRTKAQFYKSGMIGTTMLIEQ